MKSDTLNALARVKSLALARMIEAGGKPCWVAAYAPDSSPAAATIATPGPRRSPSPATPAPARRSVAPQYQPRRDPPPAGGLRDEEIRKLAGASPRLLAAITRAINHLGPDAPAKPRHPCAAGAHSHFIGRKSG